MIQAMETYSTSDLESTNLGDTIPSDEELDSLLARQDAGDTLTEEEYERIERAAFGEVTDPGLNIR